MCGQQPLSGEPAIRWECLGNVGIAPAGASYYATSTYGRVGSIYKGVIGAPGKQILREESGGIFGLVVADGHLYWSSDVRIMRASLDGGDQTVIAELNAPAVDAVIDAYTMDDSYVYWATSYQTAIWRSPK